MGEVVRERSGGAVESLKKHLDSESVLAHFSIANAETQIIAASDVVAKASPRDPAGATAQKILGAAWADLFAYQTAASIIESATVTNEAGPVRIIPAPVASLASGVKEIPTIAPPSSKRQK